MGDGIGVTFLSLWWAEFHAEKEMGAKLVGLPGSSAHISHTLFDTHYSIDIIAHLQCLQNIESIT